MASRGNTKLSGFYFPWPLRNIQFARQIDQSRENTFKLAPLVRAAYVDPQPVSANAPGEHDLSGWAVGKRDFRNKFRIYYDQQFLRFAIQHNVGTEAVETWEDMIWIRESDGRVSIVQDGGLEAQGGFYNQVPRNLATSGRFQPASNEWIFTHNLNTKPILWDTFNLEDKSIVPVSVDVSDPNTAYFYFSTPQSGTAVVTGEQSRFEGIRVSDGDSTFDHATRLGFDERYFYLATDGHGMPVVALQPLDLSESDPSTIPVNLHITDTGASQTFDLSTIAQPAIVFNQADFYFATDTNGDPIINIRGGAGGGGSSGQFGTGIFAQDFGSSNEWVLNHGLGVANILWSVYDDNAQAVIPQKVSVRNQNIAYFYFNPATSGRAVVGGGPIFQSSGGSGSIAITETRGAPTFSAASTLKFNSHDFYLTPDSSGQPIVNISGLAGATGVTAHGDLTGLLNDDHPQYARKAATQVTFRGTVTAEAFYLTPGSGGEFSKQGNDVVIKANNGNVIIDDDLQVTGTVTLITPVLANQAATKGYVDLKLQQFYNNMGGSSGGTALTVGESDGTPPDFLNVDTLRFDSSTFYLNPSSTGKPIVSIRAGTLDTSDFARKSANTNTFLGEVVAESFYIKSGMNISFDTTNNRDLLDSPREIGLKFLAPGVPQVLVGHDGVLVRNRVVAEAFYVAALGSELSYRGVRTPAGSIALPSVEIGETNTGLHLAAAGDLRIAIQGTFVAARFHPFGIQTVDGVAATPSFAFINDPDTGLYSAAPDTIGFAAQGSQVAVLGRDGLRVNNKVKAEAFYIIGGGSLLTAVVQDTAPQLGGNLNVNDKIITGPGDVVVQNNANFTVLAANDGSGKGGVSIQTGLAFYANAGSGGITIEAGTSTNGSGGDVGIGGGIAVNSGNGGTVTLLGGDTNSGVGGDIVFLPGTSVLGNSGEVLVFGNMQMNGFYIGGLPLPKHGDEAANKAYVDAHAGGGTGDIRSDGTVPFAANESMGGFKLTSVGTPTAATDAATKGYVDSTATPGFYGVIFSDGTTTKRTDRLSFNGSEFYLDGRRPTVNIKESGIDHNLLANLTVGDPHTQYIRIDGTRAFTGDQSLGSHKLTNVTDPASAQDAATKNYVDANAGPGFYGVIFKESNAGATVYRKDTLIFDSRDFYLNPTSTGKPMVSLRDTPQITFTDGVNSFTTTSRTVRVNTQQFYMTKETGGTPEINLKQAIRKSVQFFTAAREWQHTHNFGDTDLIFNVYDNRQISIIPGKADVSDPNTAYFYFATTRTGKSVIFSVV